MTVGGVLRSRREELGLSLRTLAASLGVDAAYLSRVERDVVPPSDAVILSLARDLSLSADEIAVLAGKLPQRWQSAFQAAPQGSIRLVNQALSAIDSGLLTTSSRNPMAFSGTRAIETDRFPFEHLSEIAEVESWRKEIHRPTYHLHKWWAQRLGSVFRAIILGAFSPRGVDLLEMFYQPTRLPDAVVYDPFMGSGTTVGEALKVGARAIGRDINPVAHFSVKNALRPHSLTDVEREYRAAIADVRAEVGRYYRAHVGGHDVEVQYYFWVRYLACPNCSERVDLFRTYVFSRHAYARRNPEARVLCPSCGAVNCTRYDIADMKCDVCAHAFDATDGSAKRSMARCRHCEGEFPIAATARELGQPPASRMYAKITLDPKGGRVYSPVDEHDLGAYRAAEAALGQSDGLYPLAEIKPGYNTQQALSNGFKHWHQMFNARQLLVLGTLGRRLGRIHDQQTRDLLICAFSGLLEFNNMFASFKGEGTGAVRHMFSHHILKPERTPFEANPLADTGSGNFEGIFQRRVRRLIQYAADPVEIRIQREDGRTRSAKVGGLSAPIGSEPSETFEEFAQGSNLYLSLGDSSCTDLPDESVDAIITDPPFFDNVHYSELADFFWVWQRHLVSGGNPPPVSTRSAREVQHGDGDEFAARLGAVLRECRRVLMPHGLMVFTYHHSRPEGWQALLTALHSADWGIEACHPVKAELAVATPKAQAKSPIDLDVIVVCRKREQTSGPRPMAAGEVMRRARETAAQQVSRFNNVGRALSRNDVLVIVAAQVMRHLSWTPSGDEALAAQEDLGPSIAETTAELYTEQEVREVDASAQLSFV